MREKAPTPPRSGTIQVPVTTMEEIAALSEAERAELISALKEAEASLREGLGIEYESASFKDRLLRVYRNIKR